MSRIPVLRTVQQVRAWRRQRLGELVGFVPTMGALHAGHCHLVAKSTAHNDRTVVLIFVNPLQFAPHEDLDTYPRNMDRDLATLAPYNVDAVFAPKVLEMYPGGIVLDRDQQRGAFVLVQGCLETLEGALRPQFFRGVATVVTKLLNVVTPTRVYFGQKDAQQCVVVKNLVRDLLIDTEVCVESTLREPNGLAMLSRNEYLLPALKDQCLVIYEGLRAGEAAFASSPLAEVPVLVVLDAIHGVYLKMPLLWAVDYLAVSHPDTLADVETVGADGATVSVAVKVPVGESTVRLIDNIQLKRV